MGTVRYGTVQHGTTRYHQHESCVGVVGVGDGGSGIRRGGGEEGKRRRGEERNSGSAMDEGEERGSTRDRQSQGRLPARAGRLRPPTNLRFCNPAVYV